MNHIFEAIYRSAVVPVVTVTDPSKTVGLARALLKGGIGVLEITMRNDEAAECIHAVHEKVPEITVGAGTVITPVQAEIAYQAGAKYAVAPGYDEEILGFFQKKAIPFIPGTVSSTDIQKGVKAGLQVIKFFPAEPLGGLKTIEYLAAPFPMVRFLPAAGIGFDNLDRYLASRSVFACAGGFMARSEQIERQDWETITSLCAKIHLSAQKRLELFPTPGI